MVALAEWIETEKPAAESKTRVWDFLDESPNRIGKTVPQVVDCDWEITFIVYDSRRSASLDESNQGGVAQLLYGRSELPEPSFEFSPLEFVGFVEDEGLYGDYLPETGPAPVRAAGPSFVPPTMPQMGPDLPRGSDFSGIRRSRAYGAYVTQGHNKAGVNIIAISAVVVAPQAGLSLHARRYAIQFGTRVLMRKGGYIAYRAKGTAVGQLGSNLATGGYGFATGFAKGSGTVGLIYGGMGGQFETGGGIPVWAFPFKTGQTLGSSARKIYKASTN